MNSSFFNGMKKDTSTDNSDTISRIREMGGRERRSEGEREGGKGGGRE